MKAVDSETMAIVEHQYMQENKIHSKELMFTAGIGVAREILSYLASFIFDNHIKRFVFLVGKGNNGGDGCVVAQYLSENTNIPIVCYHICDVDHMSEETAFYFLKLSKNITTEQKEFLNSNNFKYGDIIIDCLLGTGYKGEIKEPYKNWIESANSSNNPIIALDIPSGLNSSTGEVVSSAIEADITLSIGLPKKGFFINDGLKHVGKIEIVDIGIHQVSQDKHMADSLEVFTSIEARTLCTRVGNCVNKRSMGTVLVIGGCINYNGAPFLAGQAALSSGAGLVTVAVPNSLLIKNIAKTESLSLITHGISDSNSGFFTEESIPQLKELAQKHSTIVLGPGFGSYPDSKFVVEFLLGLGKRTVIDADALNLISNNPEIITQNSNYVFTPHQGELERLLNAFNIEISTDRIINVNNPDFGGKIS